MTRQITLADLQSPETPGDGWYIIEAAGEYPTVVKMGDEELTFTQQLTPEALERIAAAGVPEEGLLIDRDHLSRDTDNPTEAMGWVRELAICEGALAARIEWTTQVLGGLAARRVAELAGVALNALLRWDYQANGIPYARPRLISVEVLDYSEFPGLQNLSGQAILIGKNINYKAYYANN